MGLTDQQRAAVVAEALTWVKTPYRNWSCMKHRGVDCGQLIYGIYRNVGLLPEVAIPASYSDHPGVHQERSILEELFMPYFREIPADEVKPGDPILFKTAMRHAARTVGFAHAVLVVEWPHFVLHADSRHGVCGEHAGRSPFLKSAPRRYLTLRVNEANTISAKEKVR
jgi:cell wall-associated NlpC family hydrolase